MDTTSTAFASDGVPTLVEDDDTTQVRIQPIPVPPATVAPQSVERLIDALKRNWGRFSVEDQSRFAVVVCELWEGRQV